MKEQEFETIIREQLALFKSLKEDFISRQEYEIGANLRGIEKYLIGIEKIIEKKKNGKSSSSIKFQPWVGDNKVV